MTPATAPTAKLPKFTEEHADCVNCPLKPQMERNRMCYAFQPPERFNGIMLVGEGPGAQEISRGEPFVGEAGKLLRWLLENAGIDRDECYITNATLCRPGVDKSPKLLTEAVVACMSRLEQEIAAVRPKVIVPLGGPAMEAIAGKFETFTVRERFDCDNCNEQRKVGPVLQCSKCKFLIASTFSIFVCNW